jgi:hypothetical protein
MPLKDLLDVCTISIAMAAWPEVQPVGDVPGMSISHGIESYEGPIDFRFLNNISRMQGHDMKPGTKPASRFGLGDLPHCVN